MSAAHATPNCPRITRTQAAEWFQARGYRHVTSQHLTTLAERGKGPPYARLGKYAYYDPADLEAWLIQSLKPSQAKP